MKVGSQVRCVKTHFLPDGTLHRVGSVITVTSNNINCVNTSNAFVIIEAGSKPAIVEINRYGDK
jgi:hypothetical protein